MTCNHLILAQPEAGAKIDYTIPTGESAKLSFEPGDIMGLALSETGALEISFAQGGSLTIANFGALADAGNLLYLADGTMIDPKLLESGLSHTQLAKAENDNAMVIDQPSEGVVREIMLEPGQDYVFGFDLQAPQSAQTVDGTFVMSFANGGKIILSNYTEAMAFANPPSLSMNAMVCEATGEDLVMTLQQLALGLPVDGIASEEKEAAEKSHRTSDVETAQMDAQAAEVADVAPASGEETQAGQSAEELAALADMLAEVEPAAGEASAARSNSGYGFNSLPGTDPLNSPQAIGALGRTALRYEAPQFEQNQLLAAKDDIPEVLGVASNLLDESDMNGAPLVGTGVIAVNFGVDQPGSIFSNGGVDISGSVKGGVLQSGGVPVVITQEGTGYIGKAGGVTIFTLEMNPANGVYTYTQYASFDHANASNPDDQLSIRFGFTAQDADGDAAAAFINVTIKDDAPEITGDIVTVDETNLGPIVITDTLAHSFGADVNGQIDLTGSFVASGSLKAGVLSHNGVPVSVSLVNDVYTGMAGGVTVFTLSLANNGQYTFTLLESLDHGNISDPNDVITLTFGAQIVDFDGDRDTADIVVRIQDDAPVFDHANPRLKAGLEVVDETDLSGAVVASGLLAFTFGSDAGGTVTGNGSFTSDGSRLGNALTSGGVPVVVALVGDTYTGTAGGVTIFTLKINADGSYRFELLETLDHADPNDPNDIIGLTFGVTATDADGDTASNVIRILVKDDVPTIGDSSGGVDETSLSDGALVYSDTLIASFGQDSASIIPGGSFTVNAGGVPLTLLSNGVPVNVSATANGYVGTAGGQPVFTLVIDPATGRYTYTQVASLDHPDTGDHDDAMFLSFSVDIVSRDGDRDSAEITIEVQDDGVSAVNDMSGAEEDQLITGNLLHNDTLGQDDPSRISQVVFGGQIYVIPAVGNTVITATYGTLTINSQGVYSYQATAEDPDGTEVFTYTLKDADGDTDVASLSIRVTPDGEPVITNSDLTVDETTLSPGPMILNGQMVLDGGRDGLDAVRGNGQFTFGDSAKNGALMHEGVPVVVTLVGDTYTGRAGSTDVFTLKINADGSYRFQLLETLDHANASDPNDVIELNFGVRVADRDGDTADGTITIHVHDDAPVAYDEASSVRADQSISGNVTSNDLLSQDDTNIVSEVRVGNTVYTVPAVGTVSVTGTYGTLVISASGAYTYTPVNDTVSGAENFTYVLKDGDGDTDTAELSIQVTPDAKPIIVNAANAVDETGGFDTVTGTVSVNYGIDGPGVVGASNSFSSSYALTSNGQPVSVSLSGNTYTGTAGGQPVFTLTVNANGTYSFTQVRQLDHANALDANDSVDLVFGINATDADLDVRTGTITIRVNDDGPQAVNDVMGAVEGGADVTGNVLSNDAVGLDTGASVKSITYNDVVYTLSSGWTTISTAGGSLSINNTGAYRFTPKVEGQLPELTTDIFSYTMQDRDGDTSSARLTIATNGDDAPIVTNGFNQVDETGGFDEVSGTVAINVSGDGFSKLEGTNSFSSSVSGGLKAAGANVHVTYDASTGLYTGRVMEGSAYQRTVFTMQINSDGTYSFKQMEPLDHANVNDHNDTLDLSFGVQAIDGDGDKGTGVITIRVFDDGPQAVNDTLSAEEGGAAVTGHLLANDKMGADTDVNGLPMPHFMGGIITSITHNGTAYAMTGGSVTIAAAGGTLVVTNTGAYTFTPKVEGQLPQQTVDSFTYTVRDMDGDTSSATLSVTTNGDDAPVVTNGFNQVDETGGFDTVSGSVTINVSGDGLAGVSGNNSFASTYALTHNGQAVTVAYDASTQTYWGYVPNVAYVFELKINTDGSYVFKQHGQIDHANPNDPNDFVDLAFGVMATDGDGDVGQGTITIRVNDDGPRAVNETLTTEEGASAVTGNVLSNDAVGQDGGASVKSITYNGTVYNIAAGGSTTINAAGGTLVLNSTGAYTFTPKTNGMSDDVTDVFSYTMQDRDGDTSSATLSVTTNGDDTPIVSAGFNQVDETGGFDAVSGTLSIDTGRDGLGGVTGNGWSAASQNLTWNGQQITISYDAANNRYIGHVPGVVHVFTMQYNANGTYTFTQHAKMDHAGAGDANDAFDIHFGYRATDGDGDTADSHVTIRVFDDGPQLSYGHQAVDETNGAYWVSGTVWNNLGMDGGTIALNGSVSATQNLSSQGQGISLAFSQDAGWTYYSAQRSDGNWVFQIQVNKATGAYNFVQWQPLDHANPGDPNEYNRLTFGITATDRDGDTAHNVIYIDIYDDGPTAVNDAITVDLNGGINWWSGTNIGNILTNDASGTDGGKQVTHYNIGGNNYAVNTWYWHVTGAWQAIHIASDGTVHMMGQRGTNMVPVDITYTIRDTDGDTSSAIFRLSYTDSWVESPPPPWTTGDGGDGAGAGGPSGDGPTPLVLDLDRDGIELTTKENGVFFDLEADGDLDRTSWVHSDDALLVMDVNQDGLINDHSELFSRYMGTGANGFLALAFYDTDGNGHMDAADSIWKDIMAWRDLNQDGISQEAELFSMQQLGIVSINLNARSVDFNMNGNHIFLESTFTFDDGTEHTIVDVAFDANLNNGHDPAQGLFGSENEADLFMFTAIQEGVQTVYGFNAGEGDALDLSALLSGYGDEVSGSISDFVQMREESGDTIISVKSESEGQSTFVDIARVDGLTDANLTDMIHDQNIIV
jgi:T1SS-143 domain-containing protein